MDEKKFLDKSGMLYYEEDENGGIVITGYNEDNLDSELEIPSEIDGKPVVKIGDAAFANASLRKVVIPGSVKTIGNEAFECCSQLYKVQLNCGLERIGFLAFNECTEIDFIDLPESLKFLEACAFESCSGIYTDEIIIGKNVIELGNAFTNCTGLCSLGVNPYNKKYCSIDEDGLSFYTDGAESDFFDDEGNDFIIKVGIDKFKTKDGEWQVIGDDFDWHRSDLLELDWQKEDGTKLTIGEPNAADGAVFTKDRKKLVIVPGGYEEYEIPEGTEIIGNGAFEGCQNLVSVTIPASVTKIEDTNAFSGCCALTDVKIEGKIKGLNVDDYFYDSSDLTEESKASISQAGAE